MKEIYLAMDKDGFVFGYNQFPVLGEFTGKWKSVTHDRDTWYSPIEIAHYFGIDVTKFPLAHETPIKIRAVWEQINE